MSNAEAGTADTGTEWYFGVPFPSKRKAGEAGAPATQERELRVGDRVKVVKGGNEKGGSRHDAKIGDAFTLKDWCTPGRFWRTDGGPDFYPHELTRLSTFLPDTRVRLKRHVHRFAAGDTGTVTVANDENVGVRMDEGRHWAFKPGDLEVVGMRGASLAEQADVESRRGAPDCAGRNAEQEAEPKFKAGDVVGYKPGSIMGNSRYTIKCVKTQYSQGQRYDGPTAYDFTSEGEWDTEDSLVLVATNDPALPCIVARVQDGQPRPSSWPHVHRSAAEATKEAERLASVNPGKQFDVYQRVTGRVAEQHIEVKVA